VSTGQESGGAAAVDEAVVVEDGVASHHGDVGVDIVDRRHQCLQSHRAELGEQKPPLVTLVLDGDHYGRRARRHQKPRHQRAVADRRHPPLSAEPGQRLVHDPLPCPVGASEHGAHVALAEHLIDGGGDGRHGGSLRPNQLGQAMPLLALGRGQQSQSPSRQVPGTMTTVHTELDGAGFERLHRPGHGAVLGHGQPTATRYMTLMRPACGEK
jgi:hypothetical protein